MVNTKLKKSKYVKTRVLKNSPRCVKPNYKSGSLRGRKHGNIKALVLTSITTVPIACLVYSLQLIVYVMCSSLYFRDTSPVVLVASSMGSKGKLGGRQQPKCKKMWHRFL